MDALVLRFEAPLMSFGGAAIDDQRVTREFPSVSMIAGLLANALGYDHGDFGATQRLQERMRVGARQDRPGERLVDYQTVDLGQDFLEKTGWTTWGEVEERGGGSSTGTHIRQRHYLADAVYTVVVRLEPAEERPTLDELEAALKSPERPIFLGRKACIPSGPLVVGRLEVADLRQALERAPVSGEGGRELKAQWPTGEGAPFERELYLTDERDWRNQVHVGRRVVREGRVRVEVSDG